MIYLIFNVLFSSAFTLCLKWVQVRGREDIITIGPINYVTAALLVLPQFLLTIDTVDTASVVTGGWMGGCYFIAFFFVIHAIKKVGAASTTVVSALSLLLPIACAAFLWNEIPNTYQSTGVTLALVALLLIGVRRSENKTAERPWLIPVVLVSFFLLAGCSRLAQRTLKHVSEDAQLPTFLLAAFTVASIPSVILLISRRKRIKLTELVFGLAIGSANILQSHFILKALDQFPGYVVFPVSSAGGLLLTTLVATRILGEDITKRTLAGIALAVVALVLLNWLPH